MEAELSDVQRKIIDRAAKENGFTNYEVVTKAGSSKGGNFLGVITGVTIKSDQKKLKLILKSVFPDDSTKASSEMRLGEAYLREIYVYSNIFEKFQEFEEENGIVDPFCSKTKLYGYSDVEGNECLLMEDLKAESYGLWDKTVPMTSEHIKAVLIEYAKFHAISLAMNHKRPELFKKLTKKMASNMIDNGFSVENLGTFMKNLLVDVYEAIKDNQSSTTYLKKLEPSFGDLYKNLSREAKYQCVIDHGDCWCNNFMFKYQDPNNNKSPNSIKIIDWQLSRLNSPAADFAYFFLVHSNRETLKDFQSYEELYYNSLSNRLRNFNCDPEELFPYSKWKEHLSMFMVVQMFTCFSILKIMLSESEEAPDFSGKLGNSDDMIEELNFKIKNIDIYKERVKNIVEFMKNNKFDIVK